MKETFSEVRCYSYQAPAGKDFPPHQHSTWELVYYRTGRIICPVGDEVYQSHPGMILLTPPQTKHSERAVTAYSNWYMAVNIPAKHPWPIMCRDDSNHTIGALFQMIVRESQARNEYQQEIIAAAMQQLDFLFRRAKHQAVLPEAEQTVRRAELLMGEHFYSPLTVNDIARSLGVSQSSLRDKFTRLRGQSPQEYLQEIRVSHALGLLQNSTLKLEAVASQSGFYSASHLSRHIKRATGKSPGQLRNQH